MNAESYARVKRLFQRAIELEESERAEFLEAECSTDPEVRREVENLLFNHRPGTVLAIKGVPDSRPPTRFREGTTLVARSISKGWKRHRQVMLSTFVLLIAMLGLGAWLVNTVEADLDTAASTSLKNAVWRNSFIVQQWSRAKQESVLWARDRDVRDAIAELMQVAPSQPNGLAEALRAHPAANELGASLAPLFSSLVPPGAASEVKVGYLVFDFEHSTLIAASPKYASKLARGASRTGSQLLLDCKLYGPRVQLPYRISDLFDQAQDRHQPAVTSYAVPVYLGDFEEVKRQELERTAPAAVLLAVTERPLRLGEMSEEMAASGSPADTYLFNSEGLLLSNLRRDDLLQEVGLLPEGDGSSVLDLTLRDPGRRLPKIEGELSTDPGLPLTRLVATATELRDTTPHAIIEPYRDILGREVIGAWVWLDELDIGIATEVEADFVFDSVDSIRWAARFLMGLVLILATAALYSSRSAQLLSLKVTEGQRLGQYVLLELIGEGGLGRVYKARHAMLQRVTAVKLLRTEVITEAALQRFEREVRLTSRLTHPNTIQVYDYGRSESGIFYYAMEYLPGITLAQLMRREPQIPLARTIYIMRQVLGSLSEAHGVGLIHRDIKPQNIMINRRGGQCDVVKVLDFGLVKCIDNENGTELTTEGMISGTPLYIAPERFDGEQNPDARSDLYAVGTLLYLMLTGEPPFDAENRMDLCLAVMNKPAPRASEHAPYKIPGVLDDLVAAALSKKPDQRPQDAESMISILEELQLEFPWSRSAAAAWWDRQA